MATEKTVKKPRTTKSAPTAVEKLKLLVTVVNRRKAEFFIDFLQGFQVNFQTSVLAQGTARSETLHLLGLEDADRSVIFSVIKESQAESALQGLEDKFYKLRGGKGIAFTVPLSSVIGAGLYKFLSNNKAFGSEEK